MFGTSSGVILLTAITALIYLGFLHRVLDRMRLTKGQALALLLFMVVSYFLPSLKITPQIYINLGGALIPLGICFYLLFTADTREEKIRGGITPFLVFMVVYSSDKILSIRPGSGPDLDPLFIPPLAAGIIAYLWGRSRRVAFIGGVIGVVLLEVVSGLENFFRGLVPGPVVIGGGGVFGAAVIAGILAVFLAEIVGETRERLQGGPKNE
ncbi:MAG: DUF1614 domain-containing protein [Candidatus Syntrophonatronum acetioxidans]|uniref:DUF1614 domain-containing protein n=1 Tax=Candidatus Syntrophonatronum acetioxidans TaxID=1795816 RepID=A0A424YA84_9FIRM|nr:MAG: DUF1614 domain-containing protein [Candidatus Syntrophonatronum acetioxidans]